MVQPVRGPSAKAKRPVKVRIKPDMRLEISYPRFVAGVDEAGRGPLAGPVVAAAVIIPEGIEKKLKQVRDSKLLTAIVRAELYEIITGYCIYGIGICEVGIIAELNILGATKHAMSIAVTQLSASPQTILVDGNQKFQSHCEVVPIVNGDNLCLSIACASVIAKVTRDRIMHTLAESFPHYRWEKNAGYGTKEHLNALDLHGITPHHRIDFAPVRNRMEKRNAA